MVSHTHTLRQAGGRKETRVGFSKNWSIQHAGKHSQLEWERERRERDWKNTEQTIQRIWRMLIFVTAVCEYMTERNNCRDVMVYLLQCVRSSVGQVLNKVKCIIIMICNKNKYHNILCERYTFAFLCVKGIKVKAEAGFSVISGISLIRLWPCGFRAYVCRLIFALFSLKLYVTVHVCTC